MAKPVEIKRRYWGREIKRTEILVRDLDMKPLFTMMFYGDRAADLMVIMDGPSTVAVGGQMVRNALKRRGLDPDQFVFSLFDCKRLKSVYI